MSAIIPHVEHPSEATPMETQYWRCVAGETQLNGVFGDGTACPNPHLILRKNHMELLAMVYVRNAVEASLQGRTFVVQQGKPQIDPKTGTEKQIDKSTVYMVLDGPIGEGPPWNPAATPSARSYNLLTWTSKMNAPSWSIPAGAPEIGGSCPGATAGQTVVPENMLVRAARPIKEVTGEDVDLTRSICNYCVTGDSLVMVRGRGLVRVEDLVGTGDFEVWSGVAWRKTHAVFNGFRHVVTLRDSWGRMIRVTPDHKIMTANGMVEAQDLQPGDQLVFQPSHAPDEIAAQPIARRVSSPRHHNAVAENFPTTWTRDVGLVLGYIMGDGSVHYPTNGYPMVRISSAAHDRPDMLMLRDVVASWCSTKADVTETKSVMGYPQAVLQWRVKALVEFLEDCGLDKKAPPESRRAPQALFTAGTDAVRGFLSGLFSTDGCFTSTPDSKCEISMSSVSEGLLRDVQQLLFTFGVRASICPYASSSDARVAAGHRPLWKLGINAIEHVRLFAAQVGFANVRKQEHLDKALANDTRKGISRVPTVESVTSMRIEEAVFDLVNVGDEHQFVANGITVSNCYATGGQYATGGVQFAQALRHIWVRQAIMEPVAGPHGESTLFIETMTAAIQNANFYLGGGRAKVDDAGVSAQALPPEHTGKKFFRIHDSGDFFSPEYFTQWKAVADRCPDVSFWSPSRVWALGQKWIDHVNRVNAVPGNFTVRPSAYHIDGPCPQNLGPGWASGSTVFSESVGALGTAYEWQCDAYATGSHHQCRSAKAPPGLGADNGRGCRACWIAPNLRINYSPH